MSKKKYTVNGVVPSPKDIRDYTISMAIDAPKGVTSFAQIELPDEYKVWTPPNYDQGTAGSCVACTLAAIYDCVRHKFENEYKQHSIGFIYGNRKNDNFRHPGMIPRYACDNTVDYGDILSEIWDSPRDVTEIIKQFEKIYDEYKHLAFKPFSKYIALNSVQEVKTFIYKYKIPIMICTDSKNIVKNTDGSHALLCYGWKNDNLLWQNSWYTYKPHGEISFDKVYDVWGLVPKYIDFSDVATSDWFYSDIMKGFYDGYALGYPDGTFCPNNSITRAEFTVLLYRISKGE